MAARGQARRRQELRRLPPGPPVQGRADVVRRGRLPQVRRRPPGPARRRVRDLPPRRRRADRSATTATRSSRSTDTHAPLLCASCHKSITFKPVRTDCFGCHAEPAVHKGRYGTDCERCHSTRTFADIKALHDVGDFSLTGAHDQLDCARCHPRGEARRGSGNLCITCHRKDDIHRNSLSPRCGECHTQRSFAPARFDHLSVGCGLTGLHGTLPCADCHKSGNFGAVSPICIELPPQRGAARADARSPDAARVRQVPQPHRVDPGHRARSADGMPVRSGRIAIACVCACACALAAPARADDAAVDKPADQPAAEGAEARTDLRLTLSTFLFRETGDAAPPIVDMGADVASASPVRRYFGDLRLELTDGGFELDGRVRQTTSERYQSGASGGGEYELRKLSLRVGSPRRALIVGRQFVDAVGATKIDGAAFVQRLSKTWSGTLFGGAFPQLGSRSLDTDYPEIRNPDGTFGRALVPITGGARGRRTRRGTSTAISAPRPSTSCRTSPTRCPRTRRACTSPRAATAGSRAGSTSITSGSSTSRAPAASASRTAASASTRTRPRTCGSPRRSTTSAPTCSRSPRATSSSIRTRPRSAWCRTTSRSSASRRTSCAAPPASRSRASGSS